MINYDLIDKYKNKIISFGVIILALFIAFRLYESTNKEVSSLMQEQSNELKKNKIVADISDLEKKVNLYKKVFDKKDLASIVGVISGFARDTSIKIVSIKPFSEETLDNYVKSTFLITLNAPSFHSVGSFVSKIENYKDIYMVGGISIKSMVSDYSEARANVDLSVNLKINVISYL